ncbi:MAG: hypothetical protein H6618_06560 [Deltaproteobacteria bacterium]|nr:hypothetical protein [Deltaproteobacteria bacterium]
MNSYHQDHQDHPLSTALFIPAWWVKAFESTFDESQGSGPPRLSVSDIAISPAYSPVEAGFIPHMISSFQSQLIKEGVVSEVYLESKRFTQAVGVLSPKSRRALQWTLQSLGGMRLYTNSCNNKKCAIPLFDQEVWHEPSEGKGFCLKLGLLPYTRELICGYLDGYQEINRKLAGQPLLQDIISLSAPLCLSRSLWSELQGIERVVALNLEKAVQWDRKCFGLNGIFGEQVDILLAFQRDASLRGKGKQWNFTKQMTYLNRLAQKLTEHGSLSRMHESDYLAFHIQDQPAQLLWKIAPERLYGEAPEQYRDSVFMLYEQTGKRSFSDELWIRQLLPKAQHSRLQSLEKIFYMLRDASATEAIRKQYLVLSENQLLPVYKLYIEWALRTEFPDHESPLPDLVLKRLSHALPASGALESSWKSAFVDFQKALPDLLPFLDALQQQKQGVVITRTIRSYDEDTEREQTTTLSSSHQTNKPSFQHSDKEASVNHQELLTPSENPLSDINEEKAAALIRNLQKSKRPEYLELMEEYLQSLDEGGRKLMSDIRERMQAGMFEQHMHHRLVRFFLQKKKKAELNRYEKS